MGWTWRYVDEQGADKPVAGIPAVDFPAQADAETWIGEHWRELLDAGVEAVILVEDGRTVYGPMSLKPAD
jgi:hypothetical protein